MIVGPIISGFALLCLWANEGRFDYHAAAKRALVLADPSLGSTTAASAYTGTLEPLSFEGQYVTQFENYLVVDRIAQIYSWVKHRRDDRDVWEREWRSHVEGNHRNDGISQTLTSGRLTPAAYHIDALEVAPNNLHFADERQTLDTGRLSLTDQGREIGLRSLGNYFYFRKHAGGGDQLGDERLSFRAIPAVDTVSYFGLIEDGVGRGKVFEEKSGFVSKIIQDDGVLHHLVQGNRETALATMKGHLQRIRWTVRIAGTAGTVFGVVMTLGKMLHLLMGIPVLGWLVRRGVLVVSVFVGVALSVAVISASWLMHHPVLAFMVIGGLVGAGLWIKGQRKASVQNANQVLKTLENEPVLVPGSVAELGGSDSGGTTMGRAEHVFQHLVKIAVSDGKFDQTENTFLADWARARDIPDESIVKLFNQAKRDEPLPPLEATREDLFYLISLSLADDHLSTKELKRIRRFAQDLGMGEDELEGIIQGIRHGKLEGNAV